MRVSAHDNESRLKLSHLAQNHFRRRHVGFQYVKLTLLSMSAQELGRELCSGNYFFIVAADTQEMYGFITSKTEELECLQRARNFTSSSICHNHAIA
jgi:hypothetical protein